MPDVRHAAKTSNVDAIASASESLDNAEGGTGAVPTTDPRTRDGDPLINNAAASIDAAQITSAPDP